MADLGLTPQIADALADAVRQGVPIDTAVTAAGISRQRFYEWLKAASAKQWSHGDPVGIESQRILSDFADKIARARADFEARQVRGIVEAAEQANLKTGQRDWRARAWLLNNHPAYSRTYRQETHSTIDQTVQVNHFLTQTEALDDDALAAAYAALPAPGDTSENVQFSEPSE